MKKGILSLLIWSMSLLLLAQSNTSTESIAEGKGIKWMTGLSWEQVKEKAKAENKYIFVDVYATWCGPCKLMDKNVYTADSVADFFNEKFIAVKVQMDKTEKDDETVKKWYDDADTINKQYHVEGYPTFLFFSANGQLTDKQLGYKSVSELVAIGKSATVPGKLYDDVYADYNRKVAAYKNGERNYDQYPSMVKMADKLQDTALSRQLRIEFADYASNLPPKERYTKERIELWNNAIWGSNTKVFGYFYKDAKLINKVMDKKDYAESFVDKTIQYQFVLPFLKEQAKGSGVGMEGAYLNYDGGSAPNANYSEADWQQLGKLIKAKFGKDYAKRNVLKARVEWYKRHLNKNAVMEYTLKLYNYVRPDMRDKLEAYSINAPAWDAFLKTTDKKILKGYAKWVEKSILNYPNGDAKVDTYANILYKLGHKSKAIEWEKKAVKLGPQYGYSVALEQMKRGEPTYVEQANWEGVKTVQWENVKFDKRIEIVDVNNQPISGSTISNKRTKEIITIKEGKTSAVISVSLGDTVKISAPGYQSQEIIVTKNNYQRNVVTLIQGSNNR